MKIIIVGNNVAGTMVAKGLRDADDEVDIHVFTEERTPYYARPKLIDFIAGEVTEDRIIFYPAEWYDKNRIELHLGSKVEAIDPQERKVLADGEWHGYDKLLLANGSKAFIPPFKGLPKKNLFTLRTIDDAMGIRAAAARSSRAVIIGGGLLGLETARALSTGFPNLKVTVLEYAEHLLMRQLDHEGAKILQDWITGQGTEVLTKAETEEILGGDAVTGVKLKDGRTVECDMVIVSAGARSDTRLAKEAGMEVNRGVVVDSSLRTSKQGVYAVGDVAEYEGRVWGMIPPALEQARIVSKKMLGIESPDYGGTVPSNTLKVMGIDLTSIGTVRSEHEPPEADFEEIRAVTADGKVYKKFVLKDGRMIGAILLGTKKETPKVTKLIKSGESVEGIRESLSDPGYAFE